MSVSGDKLFLDKRDNTEFDLLTVNETSVEPPADDGNSINSPRNLALEATFINHNFSQQVSTSHPSHSIFKIFSKSADYICQVFNIPIGKLSLCFFMCLYLVLV